MGRFHEAMHGVLVPNSRGQDLWQYSIQFRAAYDGVADGHGGCSYSLQLSCLLRHRTCQWHWYDNNVTLILWAFVHFSGGENIGMRYIRVLASHTEEVLDEVM